MATSRIKVRQFIFIFLNYWRPILLPTWNALSWWGKISCVLKKNMWKKRNYRNSIPIHLVFTYMLSIYLFYSKNNTILTSYKNATYYIKKLRSCFYLFWKRNVLKSNFEAEFSCWKVIKHVHQKLTTLTKQNRNNYTD